MHIVSRSEWGARPPRSAPATVRPDLRAAVMVHYSTGEELGRADTAEWVRQIQAHHVGANGWSDIGYNFLVDRLGVIYEGRGWDTIGAHCAGYNAPAVGICFLGDDDPGTDVPPAAWLAINALHRFAEGRSGHSLARLGHRDKYATACPGDELYHGFTRPPAPAAPSTLPPRPQPRPAPRPAAPKELTVRNIDLRNAHRTLVRGPGVKPMQRLLGVTADGLGGGDTRAALGAAQKRAGLRVDYIFGPATAEALLAGK